MNIIWLLIAVNCCLPLWCIQKSCLSREGLEINHVLMFSFGFLLYWIFPIAVGESRAFDDVPTMTLWSGIYDSIPRETLAMYLVISFGAYVSFWLGNEWIRKRKQSPPEYRFLAVNRKLLFLPLAFGVVVAASFAILFRNSLFTGYTLAIGAANEDIRKGTFVASSVFLLALAFVYTVKLDETRAAPRVFWKLVLNPFFISYFIASILVLSLGGRLYFISGLVMLLVYRTNYFQRIPIRTAIWLFVIGIVFAGFAGLVRQSRNISLQEGWMLILVEPLFTAFSLLHFLRDNAFEWLKFPIFLISNFINLIPSSLFPQKLDYMLNPEDFGYVVYSPGGAENSFFSFMVNFGVLGTYGALFSLGALLNYLKYYDRNLLFRVIYVMLSGWLGFTFFRDPFFISIVKTMFQESFLTPVLLVVLMQILSAWLKNTLGSRGVGNDPASIISAEQSG